MCVTCCLSAVFALSCALSTSLFPPPLLDCLYSLLVLSALRLVLLHHVGAGAERLKMKPGKTQLISVQTQIHRVSPREQDDWSESVSLLHSVIAHNKCAVSLKVSAPCAVLPVFFLYLFICGVSHQVMWPCPASHCLCLCAWELFLFLYTFR